jgi:hypothetical protein
LIHTEFPFPLNAQAMLRPSNPNGNNSSSFQRRQKSPEQRVANGVAILCQPGGMNDGIEAFRLRLQKELGLLIGPKDPLLAQKELLEQNAAEHQRLGFSPTGEFFS